MPPIGDQALREDAVLGVGGQHVALGEVRVDLDLVDRRHHRRRVEEPVEVLAHEVADADRADLAVREQLLQRPVCLDRQVEAGGQGLVQDQQVELVDAEGARTAPCTRSGGRCGSRCTGRRPSGAVPAPCLGRHSLPRDEGAVVRPQLADDGVRRRHAHARAGEHDGPGLPDGG
jgi:hypothetical protein